MSRDYFRVRIDAAPSSEDITDLAAAFLAEAGFEMFEPDASGLFAYIPGDLYPRPEETAREALEDFPIETEFSIRAELVPGKDWNEEWEKNYFKPIIIDDKCVVHSSFHTDVPAAEYDIVIDPKMAFGTGHHHTTSRMASWILDLPMKGKSVIDMGTGTGILAILAAMRGAKGVAGIEIDPGAHENAVENVGLNNVDIRMICGDASALKGMEPADCFFANINRNIILADLPAYVEALKPGGTMLLSGFYDTDLPLIEGEASKFGLHLEGVRESDHWIAARFVKK